MKKLLFGLILIATSLLIGCTTDDVIMFGSIYGTVTNSKTGEPVQNAEIILSPGNLTTVSGSNGHFEFNNLDAGQYKLGIEAEGYEYNSRQVSVVPGEKIMCDFIITPKTVIQNLIIDPTNLVFGTTQTQLSVSITNAGTKETEWSFDLGNNNWLSVTPKSGRIAVNKTQTAIFTVDRKLITEDKTTVINLSAFGNSYPISIQCSAVKTKGELVVEPSSIDFGSESTEIDMKIRNIGNGALKWSISNIKSDALSASATSGSLEPNANVVVTIKLDRSKLAENLATSFVVSDGTTEKSIPVTATYIAPKGEMKITSTILDFGETVSELPLKIENIGNAPLKWNIMGLTGNYLALSSTSGEIPADGNVIIQVKLNRANMPDNLNTTFIVSDGVKQETITVKAATAKPVMSISPISLDFGETTESLKFTISNTGNAELNWAIKDISSTLTSVSPMSGNIPANGYKEVTVTLNRAVMSGDLTAYITVSGGNKEEKVSITAKQASPMSSIVVSSGLTAYYTFDSDFNDLTGNGYNGFGVNDPSFVDGITENTKAVKFTSVKNDYVQITHGVGDSKSMTIAFWGKDFSDGNIFYILNSNNKAIASLALSGNSLKYVTGEYKNYHGYNQALSFSHPTITDNKWHHIAIRVTTELDTSNMVYYLTKTSLFIDGSLVDIIYTGDMDDVGKGRKLIIGGKYQYNNQSRPATNMTIDNFRIYNTTQLKDDEIKTIYNAKQ